MKHHTKEAEKMIVCAHGDVEKYCLDRGMVICAQHIGAIESYEGSCRVLVTDADMSENEFYALKLKMLRRGVELVSTRHSDEAMAEFVAYLAQSEKREKHGGRRMFGLKSGEEMAVVYRIFELRDAGCTLKEISEDPGVGYLDGRKMSLSTIQTILKNRNKY